ncbi:MAG: hypothetical protein J7L47_09175 [Candidatus Odinarchaeota archaeon]|nr:hypothetical protein [Candidatus Odinarchaeota archaeon]
MTRTAKGMKARKNFRLSLGLIRTLKEYSIESNKDETAIVEEALTEYFKAHGKHIKLTCRYMQRKIKNSVFCNKENAWVSFFQRCVDCPYWSG